MPMCADRVQEYHLRRRLLRLGRHRRQAPLPLQPLQHVSGIFRLPDVGMHECGVLIGHDAVPWHCMCTPPLALPALAAPP